LEIRRILVHIDASAFSPELVRCADALAQRFDADLIGVSAAQPYPLMAGGRNAMVTASLYAREHETTEARLRALGDEFRKHLSSPTRAEWRFSVEPPTDALVSAARSADLIVVGSEEPGTDGIRVDVGELIIAAGRPVLAVAAGAEAIRGETVLVGWKDTREARRAVSDALPMLRRAKKVVVAAIGDGEAAEQRESLTDLLDWLRRHEIKPTGDLHPAHGDAAQQLEELARSEGADFLVTGGYGRSRLEEWLWGGVTRGLLARKTINRFMSN
jgi:nucleotide-binding universal stress UspA family protein